MRATRWFGLLLVGLVALSGAASASAGWNDLIDADDDSSATDTGAPVARAEASPAAPLAPALSLDEHVDAAVDHVREAFDSADAPTLATSAPTTIDDVPADASGAAPIQTGPEPSPGTESQTAAEREPERDAHEDEAPSEESAPLVPAVSLPIMPELPAPFVPQAPVPTLTPPALEMPEEEDGAAPATPSDSVATPSSVASPRPVSSPIPPAVAAAAVAGVAVAAVAAAGATGGTQMGAPFARLVAWLRGALWLPLYARVAKDQVLDHATRQELLDRLRAMPGACVAELHAASGVSLNTIRHHLRVLQANGVVTSVRNGRRRCFFALERGMSAVDRVQTAALSARAPRRVFRAIEARPGIAQHELASVLGVTPTSVAFHARRLLDAGVVRAERDGRALLYYPAGVPGQ